MKVVYKKQINEITNIELLSLFHLARGVWDGNYSIDKVSRWSAYEIMINLGVMKILFGIIVCQDQNDVRIGTGYSFHMKEWIPEKRLSVSSVGEIEEKPEFADGVPVIVLNQNLLFKRLESMNYL